jgi:hypothetical protein
MAFFMRRLYLSVVSAPPRDWRPDMAAFMSALRASLKNGLLTDDHVQTMLVINMFAVAVVQGLSCQVEYFDALNSFVEWSSL